MPDVLQEKSAAPKEHAVEPLRLDDISIGGKNESKENIVPPYIRETPASVENANRGSLPRVADQRDLRDILADLQIDLHKTQTGVNDLLQQGDPSLYDLDQSRRGLMTNPYKVMTGTAGMLMLNSNPLIGVGQIAAVAALQGYDDYKNLRSSDSLLLTSKYATGMAADLAIAAGSAAFLLESIPMKYKAPLLIGGIVLRSALDLIPNRKLSH